MNAAETTPADSIPVLDHGYVLFVEAWGHGLAGQHDMGDGADYEVGIVEAARQSTQGGFKGWDVDAKLLRYLWMHRHTTPFEFAGMTLEVRAPIMVYREWHRHRTQSYSEASARYGPLANLHFMPSRDRIIMGVAAAGDNRQMQGQVPLNTYAIDPWLANVADYFDRGEQLYQEGLKAGFPKEIARIVHTVARYSTMRVTTDLWNWLHFTQLRHAPNAQEEIRMYAGVVLEILAANFPRTLQQYIEGGR